MHRDFSLSVDTIYTYSTVDRMITGSFLRQLSLSFRIPNQLSFLILPISSVAIIVAVSISIPPFTQYKTGNASYHLYPYVSNIVQQKHDRSSTKRNVFRRIWQYSSLFVKADIRYHLMMPRHAIMPVLLQVVLIWRAEYDTVSALQLFYASTVYWLCDSCLRQ